MIILFQSGCRLGNQLFQYAALKRLYPNQNLLLFGFGDLKQALESVDAIIVEREKAPRFLLFSLERLISLLLKLRIVGQIQESRDSSFYVVNMTKGLLKIYLLKDSFFQHKMMLKKFNHNLRLNPVHSRAASDWLRKKSVKVRDGNLVFVHIRRVDYLTWPSREYPAVLDKLWYMKAMEQIRKKIKNPIFLLLTDDLWYARDCFGDQPDILISENDQLVDLALMSQCRHGILSASSFAWWGAWFSKAQSHHTSLYLAPKFWGGHRKKEWVPEGFISDWITYIE